VKSNTYPLLPPSISQRFMSLQESTFNPQFISFNERRDRLRSSVFESFKQKSRRRGEEEYFSFSFTEPSSSKKVVHSVVKFYNSFVFTVKERKGVKQRDCKLYYLVQEFHQGEEIH